MMKVRIHAKVRYGHVTFPIIILDKIPNIIVLTLKKFILNSSLSEVTLTTV